ncbi:hypothetical protein BCF74_1029 [Knoellia remsis]|uniref:Uncharacterized protein n=1 Tax=Knoellia remsis TaxID=407159 RepID=A0A2T0UZB2_9MICO|nr:hypothetical protein [Knoellia remsis]PRY63178.1 hypothetical protein BCF74_1029 [Knoellia remsis]
MTDSRWAEESAVFEAEAALRQQESAIDGILSKVAEANDLMARARAELDAEADDSRADREQEEKEARTGALGRERQELQRRLDRNETTWAEVMSGRDEHPSAVAYRGQVGDGLRAIVEEETAKDPELREALDQMARYSEPGDPEVRVPDWPTPDPTSDGRRSPDPRPDDGSPQPPNSFGTW